MDRLAVAFTGVSNSGKTTIIEKIAKELITQNKHVLIIKNDPKDKAIFDYKGKDSYKFFQTGADVFVTSPTRTTLLSHQFQTIESMINMNPNFDYLLVEGLKNIPLPRIGVFRNSIDKDYFNYIDVVASDDSLDKKLFGDLTVLNLNKPKEIIKWINLNGKKV